MRIKSLSLIFLLLLPTKLYSDNIAVIDINYLINNSKHFITISEEIKIAQTNYKEFFNNTEQNLIKIKSELEDSKLILSDDEFNIQKNEYYKKVEKFENDILIFNNHYENEIMKIKNIIFSKISELIQVYASENEIDLIFDKNQYLLANDMINISDIIFNKLNEMNIEIEFEIYEN